MENDTLEVRLVEKGALASLLPLFTVINPALSREHVRASLEEMTKQGYRCAVATHRNRCVGVIGIWIQTKFYVGKHIEYDNFYVRPAYRGLGVGSRLLAFAERYAASQGCVAAELSCDVLDDSSREFWEKSDFTTVGYRYQKSL